MKPTNYRKGSRLKDEEREELAKLKIEAEKSVLRSIPKASGHNALMYAMTYQVLESGKLPGQIPESK